MKKNTKNPKLQTNKFILQDYENSLIFNGNYYIEDNNLFIIINQITQTLENQKKMMMFLDKEIKIINDYLNFLEYDKFYYLNKQYLNSLFDKYVNQYERIKEYQDKATLKTYHKFEPLKDSFVSTESYGNYFWILYEMIFELLQTYKEIIFILPKLKTLFDINNSKKHTIIYKSIIY